jgi:serine/threonine-protein kinase HipA
VRAVLALLAGSNNASADSLRFVLTLLAFWLMAAIDGHAKNFSIFLERGGGYRMTPLYDVLSAWPIIGNGPSQISPRRAKLAMALRWWQKHPLPPARDPHPPLAGAGSAKRRARRV